MTFKSSYLLWFLVALIAGAWPLALPMTQASPAQVSHAAPVETPAT